MAQAVVSKVQLYVPFSSPPVQRIIDKWVNRLKDEATSIFQKIQLRIPNETEFQNVLAQVSSASWAPMISPTFFSRAGVPAAEIISNQATNLKESFGKYIKKLTHIFETVDTVEAKRFKEVVDLMQADFAAGIAKRTLPFTGTKIEGRSAATIAPLWLVDDVRASGLIRNSDEVLQGGPKRICSLQAVPTLKAALQDRLVQAGNNIVKANFLAGTFTAENDTTNAILNGFRDPALNIEVFTTGGFSHVDYILKPPQDQLFLEVQVAVTP